MFTHPLLILVPLNQDFSLDPCACSASGVIEGMDTGRRGCRSHNGRVAFCHTTLNCTTANKAPAFPKTKWRNCNTNTDNDPAYKCVPCIPGYSSNALSERCSPCPPATFAAHEEATSCSQCPADRPTSEPGSTSINDCARECTALDVAGCVGLEDGLVISGAYELFEGECGSTTAGSPVFFNRQTKTYLYALNPLTAGQWEWIFGPTCGSTSGSINSFSAIGGAGFYPHVNTVPEWGCSQSTADLGFEQAAMSLTCEAFAGEQRTCASGTYNSTALGPDGVCNRCPPHLETTFPGATSVTDCFTIAANVFAVSQDTNRVTVYSPGSSHHNLLAEKADGGMVDSPMDIVFISETIMLVSMLLRGALILLNVEGEELGVFANVGRPWGLLFLHEHRMVAVADTVGYGQVLFFKLDDFTSKGRTLEESDAVGTVEFGVYPPWADSPRFMSMGENDSEVLVTTWDDHVVRICVPGTSCDPEVRNSDMLSDLFLDTVSGIGVIRAKNIYLLCETPAYKYTGDAKVWACPLDLQVTDIYASCSEFAFRPEGTPWNPFNFVVDDSKQLVYITDQDYSAVYVFSFDGDYFGHLAQSSKFLAQPSSLALKPGPLAAVSPIFPPASATAGVLIVTPVTLHDRANTPLPATYDMTEDLPRFRISATGLLNGIAATVHGSVPSASEAHILIKFAGVWTVSITEGIKNPEPLLGSPYEITVQPAETDPAECEAEFERVLTAGSFFSLNINMVDAFGNPTEGAEFNFSCCVGEAMTKAGEYTVDITPAIKSNPFRFDVKAGTPSALASTHAISEGSESLELRVFPKDKFNNTITDATGYCVSIDGGGDIPLIAPDFFHAHAVEEGSVEVR